MSSLDYLDLCRLCLVKDRVSVPIFDGEGDVRQIFLKIAACLPVKVAREDKLPKKICDDCVYKVELFYQFWNTTANAEKQLLQWLGDVGLEEKQGYVSEVLSSEIMKQEESENRLDVSVMQATGEHTDNMAINIIDDMNLGIPIIMSTDQQITVPINSNNNVQTGQSVPGPSARSTHDQVTPKSAVHDAEEDTSEDDNTDDDCDADEGLAVKEEGEDTTSGNRAIEPTTFVNVALACDEAGPSGLQQQKLVEMPTMGIQQSSEGDPKSGFLVMLDHTYTKLQDMEDDNKDHIYITIKNENGSKIETKMKGVVEDSRASQVILDPPKQLIIGSPEKQTEPLLIVKEESQREVKKSKISSKQYYCEQCNKSINKKIQYLRHCQNHERDSGRHCTHCNQNFYDDEKFKKHMIKAHQEDKPYSCMLCGKCFKTEAYLRIHLKQHNKRFTCEICGVSKVSGYDLRLHKKKHNQEYVTYCEICNKGFYTNQTLERHILTHTGEKPFICNICNAAYASSAYLNTHMKSHGQREKYKCIVCNFESYWKAALKVHMKIHTGENQIACEICGKSVSSKTYLQVHMRIHSGEKPYECEVCGKAFSVRKYLIVHKRTHTGERPYECKICHRKFTQQGSLNSHMKSHNELK